MDLVCPASIPLPLVAIRLLLTEHAKNTPDTPGYSRLPIEANDAEGNHWTVATRDTPEPGIYLVREPNPFRINQARTEGRKAESELAHRLNSVRSLESKRASALKRFVARNPEDMPSRPSFEFEHDELVSRLRSEAQFWQSEVARWTSHSVDDGRVEFRFAPDLLDVVVSVCRVGSSGSV